MAQECLWLWDDVNKVWVKAQCDVNGNLLISGSADALADLTDVDLTGLTDGDFIYYDAFFLKWKRIAHKDATTGVHGVGAGTVAKVSDIAVLNNIPNLTLGKMWQGNASNRPAEVDPPTGGKVLVSDTIVSSNISTITVSGLNGDADVGYEIHLFAYNSGTGIGDYHMRPNNDSGANYPRQYLTGIGTTVSAGRDITTAFTLLSSQGAGLYSYAAAWLIAKSGARRHMWDLHGVEFAGPVMGIITIYQCWTNTADNITNLVFTADIYGAGTFYFGAGSRLLIYKNK